ncbi:hypothetical protein HRbin18_00194 [bacterium HR18]|nr:hypothetical protein HRbin18_00194 [bacterium HR18]
MVQQLTAQLAQAYRAGNRAQVLLLADSLCQIAPESPEGYVWKAALLRELGQLSQAEALLYEALARAPAHPEARLLLARVVEQQGHLRKAVSLYRHCARPKDCFVRPLGLDLGISTKHLGRQIVQL